MQMTYEFNCSRKPKSEPNEFNCSHKPKSKPHKFPTPSTLSAKRTKNWFWRAFLTAKFLCANKFLYANHHFFISTPLQIVHFLLASFSEWVEVWVCQRSGVGCTLWPHISVLCGMFTQPSVWINLCNAKQKGGRLGSVYNARTLGSRKSVYLPPFVCSSIWALSVMETLGLCTVQLSAQELGWGWRDVFLNTELSFSKLTSRQNQRLEVTTTKMSLLRAVGIEAEN